MAHDLLARLTATKEAAEGELKIDAERVRTARLERAIIDFSKVADAARSLARLIAAHRDNNIAIAIGGDREARLRHAAEALLDVDGLDGEQAEGLGIDTERAY